LPKSAPHPPTAKAPDLPLSNASVYSVRNVEKKSNEYNFEIESVSPSQVIIPVFNFPGWLVTVNGTPVPVTNSDVGAMMIEVNQGVSEVKAKLIDTPIRVIGNSVSIAGVIIVGLLMFKSFKLNRKV